MTERTCCWKPGRRQGNLKQSSRRTGGKTGMRLIIWPLGNIKAHMRLVFSDTEFKLKSVVITPKKRGAAAQNR